MKVSRCDKTTPIYDSLIVEKRLVTMTVTIRGRSDMGLWDWLFPPMDRWSCHTICAPPYPPCPPPTSPPTRENSGGHGCSLLCPETNSTSHYTSTPLGGKGTGPVTIHTKSTDGPSIVYVYFLCLLCVLLTVCIFISYILLPV